MIKTELTYSQFKNLSKCLMDSVSTFSFLGNDEKIQFCVTDDGRVMIAPISHIETDYIIEE